MRFLFFTIIFNVLYVNAQDCQGVEEITYQRIDDNSVQIFWEQSENIDYYRARIKTSDVNWQLLSSPTNISGNDSSKILNNLLANTSYEIQLKSWCNDGTISAWSNSFIFSTEVVSGCTDPSYFNYNSYAEIDDNSCYNKEDFIQFFDIQGINENYGHFDYISAIEFHNEYYYLLVTYYGTNTQSLGQDGFVSFMKLDSQGKSNCDNCFSKNIGYYDFKQDKGQDIIIDEDENIIVLTNSQLIKFDQNGNNIWSNDFQSQSSLTDVKVAELDESYIVKERKKVYFVSKEGETLNIQHYFENNSSGIIKDVLTINNEIFICGENSNNAFVYKIDENGQIINNITYPQHERAISIDSNTNGKLSVVFESSLISSSPSVYEFAVYTYYSENFELFSSHYFENNGNNSQSLIDSDYQGNTYIASTNSDNSINQFIFLSKINIDNGLLWTDTILGESINWVKINNGQYSNSMSIHEGSVLLGGNVYVSASVSGPFFLKFKENSISCNNINSADFSQISHYSSDDNCTYSCFNIKDFWMSEVNDNYEFNFNSSYNPSLEYELKYKLTSSDQWITIQIPWWKNKVSLNLTNGEGYEYTFRTHCEFGISQWNETLNFEAPDIIGCTTPTSLNYNANATLDDGSCKTTCFQLDSNYTNVCSNIEILNQNNDEDMFKFLSNGNKLFIKSFNDENSYSIYNNSITDQNYEANSGFHLFVFNDDSIINNFYPTEYACNQQWGNCNYSGERFTQIKSLEIFEDYFIIIIQGSHQSIELDGVQIGEDSPGNSQQQFEENIIKISNDGEIIEDKTLAMGYGSWDWSSSIDYQNNTTYISYSDEYFSTDGLFSDALSYLGGLYNKSFFIFSSINENLDLVFSKMLAYDTENHYFDNAKDLNVSSNFVYFHLDEIFNEYVPNTIEITDIFNGETIQLSLEDYIENNTIDIFLKFDKQGNFIEVLNSLNLDLSFSNNLINVNGNNIEVLDENNLSVINTIYFDSLLSTKISGELLYVYGNDNTIILDKNLAELTALPIKNTIVNNNNLYAFGNKLDFAFFDNYGINYIKLLNTQLNFDFQKLTCNSFNDGAIEVNLNHGNPPFQYQWSTGSTAPHITNLDTGLYQLTVTDSLGCVSSDSIRVELRDPPANDMYPQICNVTVDDQTGKNKIKLTNLTDSLLLGYGIFKEVSTDVFTQIATIDYMQEEYIDETSNPLVNANRYKIAAIDVCTNESDLSLAHKTVHLTMNEGVNGEVNLIWNPYEGFTVSNYLIYRSIDGAEMSFVGFVAGNIYSYTDLAPPSGVLNYEVRMIAEVCPPIVSNPLFSVALIADTIKSNIITHENIDYLGVNLVANNPSCPTCNDGSIVAIAFGGSAPYSYTWLNGVYTGLNLNLSSGSYTVYISDSEGTLVTETVTLSAPSSDVYGCTDSEATNYNSEATIDDGNCEFDGNACDITPTGLFVDNIIDQRVVFNWESPTSAPSYYMIRYRAVGTSSWTVMSAGPQNDVPFEGTSRTRYFMEANTTYQWNIRARDIDQNGTTICQSPWSASHQYTTLPACENMQALTVSAEANWVTFTADAPHADWGVWQSKGKMRELGTNSFRYVNGTNSINVLKGNFDANTSYEWHTKAWCTGNVDSDGNSDPMYHSGWGEFSTFSTEDACDKLPTNLSTGTNNNQNAIVMNWDTPDSGAPDHYFLELTNETTGQLFQWNNIAGNSNSKTKFGQTTGNDYSWKIRGACGTNGTSWATSFTSQVYYSLGAQRIGENNISSLEVFPNPSKGLFSISFESKESQNIEISITNYLGEKVFKQEVSNLINTYNRTIDLSNKANGIYLLSIKTNNKIFNKKIVIQ
tara:strand:- start:14315 stop:19798 length:5484 start_codon:yes stop_codon:yes gene_type:complete